MKKLGFIGIITNQTDNVAGPAGSAKAKLIELQKIYGSDEIKVVSIYKWRENKLRCLLGIIGAFFSCKNVMFNISVTSFQIVYMFLRTLNKLLRRTVHVSFIGNPIEDILENMSLVPKLNMVDYCYFQTTIMRNRAIELGVRNCYTLYNFREKVFDYDENYFEQRNLSKLCYFARVSQQKGVFDAIATIKRINEEYQVKCHLDIYGPIEECDKERFETEIGECCYITYKGTVAAKNAQATLNEYGYVLFTSRFIGEGFPGTIVDAFIVGVPVISSNWIYSNEFVDDTNGFMYNMDDEKQMCEAILNAVKLDRKSYIDKCCCCVECSNKYSASTAILTLTDKLI